MEKRSVIKVRFSVSLSESLYIFMHCIFCAVCYCLILPLLALHLTPSLPQLRTKACKLKCSGPVTGLFSILCIWCKSFLMLKAKGFQISHFTPWHTWNSCMHSGEGFRGYFRHSLVLLNKDCVKSLLIIIQKSDTTFSPCTNNLRKQQLKPIKTIKQHTGIDIKVHACMGNKCLRLIQKYTYM